MEYTFNIAVFIALLSVTACQQIGPLGGPATFGIPLVPQIRSLGSIASPITLTGQPLEPRFLQTISLGATATRCTCGYIYQPVCSLDGRSFPNECTARCNNAVIAYQGICRDPTAGVACSLCPSYGYQVCGSNGATYPNACQANCRGVQVLSYGQCSVTVPTPCSCPRVIRPVCGSDGRTYSNECEALCRSVVVTTPGPCRALQPFNGMGGFTLPVPIPGDPTCALRCIGDMSPVCGENSVTYVNSCYAQCAQVAIRSQGPCVTTMPNTTFCPQCIGVRLSPICTTDGKTFDNECLALCNGRQVAHYGTCPGDNSNGGCPACSAVEYDPVCGINGQTYPNMCESNCRRMPIIYKGKCRTDFCSCQSAQPEVVCGSDGRTYPNRCLANCRGVTVVGMSACFQPDQCFCPRLLAQVCGLDGSTYDNECLADCRGVSVAYSGPCVPMK